MQPVVRIAFPAEQLAFPAPELLEHGKLEGLPQAFSQLRSQQRVPERCVNDEPAHAGADLHPTRLDRVRQEQDFLLRSFDPVARKAELRAPAVRQNVHAIGRRSQG